MTFYLSPYVSYFNLKHNLEFELTGQFSVHNFLALFISVSSVVEFPGAGSSRLRTINSELNGAT